MARDSRSRSRLVAVAFGVSVVILLTTFCGGFTAAGLTEEARSTGAPPRASGQLRDTAALRRVTSAAAETRLTATVQDLGTLGGADSHATAMDGDIIVGWALTSVGERHAFAYDLGAAAPAMIDLGTLGGASSEATDVSGDIVVGVSRTGPRSHSFFYYDLGAAEPTIVDLGIGFAGSIRGEAWGPFVDDGAIVGQMDVGASGDEPRAFAYDLRDATPAVVNLGTLGANSYERYSYATAVDAGIVVGTSTPLAGYGAPRGFVYDLDATSPHMDDLGPIQPRAVHQRVIVGYRDLPSDPWRSRGRAFYYRLDVPTPSATLFGAEGSSADAIEGNIVAGSMRLPSGRWHPYAYDLAAAAPRLVDLGSPGGSVDVSGTTVIGGMVSGAYGRAFGYDLAAASPGMVDLGTLPGFPRSAGPVGIEGNIVAGNSYGRQHHHAVVWTLSHTSAPALVFSQSMYTTPEGDHAATVTVRRLGDTTGAATVGYTAAGMEPPHGARAGRDFDAVSGTLAFAAGEVAQTFTIPILDDSLAEDRESVALWLSHPEGGVLGTPQVAALRIGTSDIRPDGQVKEHFDQHYVGDNIYNTTGVDQTRRLTAQRGQPHTFDVAVCTDSDDPARRTDVGGRFQLHANPAAAGSRVRYYRHEVDVTNTIRSIDGLGLTVRPRACAVVEVRIAIRLDAEIGSIHKAVLTATWDEEHLRSDRVRAVVKVKESDSTTTEIAHHDPAGDVHSYLNCCGDIFDPRPQLKDPDIVKLRAQHRAHRVAVSLRFRDLLPGRWREVTERIVTPEGSFLILSTARPDGRKRLLLYDQQQDQGSHCAGLRHAYDFDTNRVHLDVPRSCIGRPDWVRVGAAATRQIVSEDATAGDDALRSHGWTGSYPRLTAPLERPPRT
jgi:probable HAF family extracellular repeat protein